MPKPYPPKFGRRALDLVAAGRTVRDVAATLGIAESCLYGWKTRDLIDRGLKPGTTSSQSAELGEARRRIRELEDEVKILRKAAAAVERVVPPKGRFQLVAGMARAPLHSSQRTSGGIGWLSPRCCGAADVASRRLYLGRTPSGRYRLMKRDADPPADEDDMDHRPGQIVKPDNMHQFVILREFGNNSPEYGGRDVKTSKLIAKLRADPGWSEKYVRLAAG